MNQFNDNMPLCPLKTSKNLWEEIGDMGYSYATVNPNWENVRLIKTCKLCSNIKYCIRDRGRLYEKESISDQLE